MAEVPKIKVSAKPPIRTDALVVLVDTGRSETDGVDWAYLDAVGFDASVGSHVLLPADGDLVRIVVGLGERADVSPDALRRAGAVAAQAGAKFARLNVDYPDASSDLLDPRAAGQALAEGLASGAYCYDRYKASEVRLRDIVVVSKLGRELSSGVQRGRVVGEAIAFARDLANEPGGSATPAALAKVVVERAMAAGLGVTLWDEKAIAKAKLGGLMAVNSGSTHPPRFIQLSYQPNGSSKAGDGSGAHLALVGKGITFDSGGLSLKTADGMATMKMDKGGAAAVLAAMCALPALKVRQRVSAFVPLTDNMPGPDAQRPGDVFTARNGKTVEVLNTDAEGRLVLADALSLAGEAKPDAVVDVATLTGAVMVALGKRIAGLMGNHDGFLDQVDAAAAWAGELVWKLPLHEEYRSALDSPVADLKNVAGDRYGGALHAGLFLAEFVPEGLPWAHLDIAGTGWSDEGGPGQPRGATGFGVRTLLRLAERFEAP
ncbi:MAG: leucyl aminopeptidase [Microthrixaceae bacterium]